MSNSRNTPHELPISKDHSNGSAPYLVRRWKWAFCKIRAMDCGWLTAIWRATRFALLGNTGRFFGSRGWTKLKISND